MDCLAGTWLNTSWSEMYVTLVLGIFTVNLHLKKVKVLVTQSCLTLGDPKDCSPPGSSAVHGISRARILEWVAISFSGGSS